MAIDNRSKRMSVAGAGRPFLRATMPGSETSIEWRMSAGLTYNGNSISGPPSTVTAWSEAAMVALIINNNTTSAPSNYLHSDRTNFRVDELKTEWTGMMVAPEEWEPRHPQEFVKTRGGEREYGPQNPEPDNTFISTAVSIDDL